MINKELKQKWIDGLRSGRYKKAKTMFCIGDCFCAFGVLLAESGDYELRTDNDIERFHPKSRQGEDGYYTVGSVEIQRNYCITAKQYEKIVQMNDLNDNTFAEIADYIEKAL
jgi:hypothetical protein